MPGPASISDPRRIRALSHPRRLDLLELLAEGPATATACARALDDSPASCSFHLRMLAKYGFVEPVPEGGRGRERPWQLVRRDQQVEPDFDDDASVLAARAMGRLFVEREAARMARWFDVAPDEPAAWNLASTVAGTTVWLTLDELRELGDLLRTATDRAAARSDDPELRPPGSRPVRIFCSALVDVDGVRRARRDPS